MYSVECINLEIKTIVTLVKIAFKQGCWCSACLIVKEASTDKDGDIVTK